MIRIKNIKFIFISFLLLNIFNYNALATNPPLSGLSSDMNYILSFSPRDSVTDIGNLANEDKGVSIMYYDGLGRPLQQIQYMQTDEKQNIYNPFV